MATLAPTVGQAADTPETPIVHLGGYVAMAESAWMGCVQATEVLDPVLAAPVTGRRQRIIPRIPRIKLAGLFTRELSIAEASFVLMASFFLSAALGAVRQVLFNAQFGVSMEANAYYAAFRLPDTLFSLIAGGALSSAMIPVLLSTRREDGEPAGWRLVNLVTTTLLAVFALVVFLGVIFAPNFVVSLLAPGFDAETSALTITLTRIMLIQPVILAVGSVATAVLNSRNQFVPTALSIISHNVALISGILVARFVPSLGIYGPTLGVLGGAILQVIILLAGLREWTGRYRPLWQPRDNRLREIVRLLIPNGASVSVNYAGFIVDTAFATKAPEMAALAAMYNAWLLVGLPIALLGQAVGQAAFPRLAAHADAGEWREMRQSLFRSLGAVLGLAVPAMLGLIFLGRLVIRLLFEHGEFDAAAGDLTYNVLLIFTFGLPAYIATEVITRGLISLRDTRTPLATNTMQLIARITLISLLLDRMGAIAIPTAFAVSAAAETLILAAVLLIKLRRRMATAA